MSFNALSLIHYAWAVLGLIWGLGLMNSKRTVRAEPASGRLLHLALILSGMYLLLGRAFHSGWWILRILPHSRVLEIAGLAFALAGCFFAIWARVVLGSNWSGRVTVKEGHELNVRGPYAIVRHPIYTGLLLAALGTALAVGEARSVVGLILLAGAFLAKIDQEERLMLETFPERYPAYRQRVKTLIPGVF
jgi:protein-S-isoprenylcysteine O-methyltransferase Ste14